MPKKRVHTDTTVPHIAANETDIMAALLKVAPPPSGRQEHTKGV